ncbi:hypothetical protein ACFCVU_20295, partial [Peribacillus butanolivorans]|uniref:hypothetical protein n=1 Tax=Peribacillus butanolivorans TaxID=421767 RepID=UPI0035D79C41
INIIYSFFSYVCQGLNLSLLGKYLEFNKTEIYVLYGAQINEPKALIQTWMKVVINTYFHACIYKKNLG